MFQHLKHRGARRRKEEQEMENLFEEIIKENFPNLAKEIDFQEVQEAQRVPQKLYPRKHTPRHIIFKDISIKLRRENLNSSKRKRGNYLQRGSHKTLS